MKAEMLCGSCGCKFKTRFALNAHEGGRPCQLQASINEMERRGFVRAGSRYQTLNAAGIYMEDALSRHERGFRGKSGKLTYCKWAPAWAVAVASTRRSLTHRKRVLAYLADLDARGDTEMVLALAALETAHP